MRSIVLTRIAAALTKLHRFVLENLLLWANTALFNFTQVNNGFALMFMGGDELMLA